MRCQTPGAAPRRRGRAPGSRSRRSRSASGGTRPRGCARCRPRAPPRAPATCVARERRRDDGVRALEEVVDDLDVLRAGAEARERIDEPLQAVVALDDLLRRRLADQVRLVVDDERARAVEVHDVDEAVQQHAVVLEREVPLLLHAVERRDAPRELGVAVRDDERADPLELVVADGRIPDRAPARDPAATALRDRPARGACAPRRRSRSRAGRRRRCRRACRSGMPTT